MKRLLMFWLIGLVLALPGAMTFAAVPAPPNPATTRSVQNGNTGHPVAVPIEKKRQVTDRFDRNAAEAQAVLASPLGSLDATERNDLAELRNRLAADRDYADTLATRGSLDLRILEAQAASLGQPPSEGETEPAAITLQRQLVDQKLSAAMKPVLALRDDQARASVLVSEIDQRMRTAANRRTFSRESSPLNPAQWMDAGREVSAMSHAAQVHFAKFKQQYGLTGPLIAALLAIAFLAFGPILGQMLWNWLSRKIISRREAATTVSRKLLLTLLLDAVAGGVFVVAYMMGACALVMALLPFASAETIEEIIRPLLAALLLVAVGRWIGSSALNSPFPELRLLTVPAAKVDAAVRNAHHLALILGLLAVVGTLEDNAILPGDVSHILSAILLGFGSLFLWRLATDIQKTTAKPSADAVLEPEAAERPAIDFTGPIARVLKVFAIASIVAAAVGYALLARYIFSATLLTLGIVGTAVYLHRSVALIINVISAGRLHRYRRALHFVPLAIGFVLTLLVLPLVAIIWGYNAREILDGLVALRNGVNFGDVRISIGDVMTFAVVFLAGYFTTRWLRKFLKLTVLPEFGMDPGAEAALLTFLGYLGITIAAVIAITTTGMDLSSLAFIAGALSVGLGFGLQSVVENFTSGIVLLVERPIKVGDWIEVGDNSGIVRRIAVRSTHVETFDRHEVIIPNSQLISGVVKNRSFSAGPVRIVVPVGVAYGSDLEKVSALLLDIARETEGVLDSPEPTVAMEGFGDSAINLKLQAFVSSATEGTPMNSIINFEIARRFEAEGIEIPFPQRDINVRSLPANHPTEAMPGETGDAPHQPKTA